MSYAIAFAVRLGAVCLAASLLAGCSKPEQAPGKPWHHTTQGFRNPPDSPARNSWMDRLPWVLSRFLGTYSLSAEAAPPVLDYVVPRAQVKPGLAAMNGRDSVTWIGHMTALLRIGGKTVLTDPWLTDHASPVRPLGPERYVPPALTVDELPPIDVIVISHGHYDHLDLPTIENLPDRGRITAIVPLGIGQYFEGLGYKRVIELDWTQKTAVDGMTVTALPVIHWSKRSLFATNDTLWTGYAIEGSNGARVYFGGDAEYGSVYRRLANRYGEFDLAILSIGAFLPRVVMNGSHCVPEDCIKIGTDLKAHTLLGIHWGTVQLGDDRPPEAVRRFREGGRAANLPDERVWLMKIGETRPLPRRPNRQASNRNTITTGR